MLNGKLSSTNFKQIDSSTCLIGGDIRVSCDSLKLSGTQVYLEATLQNQTWPDGKIPYKISDNYSIIQNS